MSFLDYLKYGPNYGLYQKQQQDKAAEIEQNKAAIADFLKNYGAKQYPYQFSQGEIFDENDPLLKMQQYNPQSLVTNVGGLLPQQDAQLAAEMIARNPQTGLSLLGQTQGKPQELDKSILAYQQAKSLGYIPPDLGFPDWVKTYKGTTNISVGDQNKPLPLNQYGELVSTKTGKSPLPSENLIIGQIPEEYVLREKPITAETAGKQAMVDTALSQLPEIKASLFEGGDVDYGKINQGILLPAEIIRSNIPIVSRLTRYGASDDAQKLATAYEFGLQGITRFETGAAMPPDEIKNTALRFFPLNTDPESVQRAKVKAYELFLRNASAYIDPDKIKRGATLSAKDVNFDKLFQDASSQPRYEYRTNPATGETRRRLIK